MAARIAGAIRHVRELAARSPDTLEYEQPVITTISAVFASTVTSAEASSCRYAGESRQWRSIRRRCRASEPCSSGFEPRMILALRLDEGFDVVARARVPSGRGRGQRLAASA